MDKRDHKIISLLIEDGRATLRNLARAVKLSKDTVRNRMRKLEEDGVIVKYRTVINMQMFGLSKYDVLFRFADEQELRKSIKKIQQRKGVSWLGICFGTYDLRMTYVCKGYDELHAMLDGLGINAEMTICKIERQTKKPIVQLNKLLLGVSMKDGKRHRLKDTGSKNLDDMDKAILNIIQGNARMPSVEMAQHLSTTPEIIRYRIAKMERAGIIQRYTIEFDTSKLGKIWCVAMMRVRRLDDDAKQALNRLVSSHNVSVYTQLTGEWNLSLGFFGNSIQEIHQVLTEIRKALPGRFIRVEPLIVLERFFVDSELPL